MLSKMDMYIIPIVPFFFALATLSTSVTAAAIQTGGLILPSLNSTTFGLPIAPVDRRFSTESYFSNDPIDELSTLMIGADTMASLALLNWIGNSRTFRLQLPNYPLVYIEMTPEPPAVEVPNRFIVWGLEMALQKHIIRNQFDESLHYLMYSGRRLGIIYFWSMLAHPQTSLALPAEDSPQTNSSVGHILNGSTASLFNTTSQSNCKIKLRTNAQLLDRASTFLTIYATLKALAFPITTGSSTEPFLIGPSRGSDVQVGFTSTVRSELPKREMRLLQYGWIIETVRQIPQWMVNHAFKEVEIGIYIENNLLGAGVVDKAGGSQVSQDWPDAQSSTS